MDCGIASRAQRPVVPPIFDGEHYAGTRYLPLPILMNALASAMTGSPVIGGKMAAAVLMPALLALVFVALRGLSCPAPLAAALAAVVLATDTGLQAGTTIGGDLLPSTLQVGALAVVIRGRGARSIVIAGVLAGLAVASKLTGFWALLSIASWLSVQRQWRAATVFSAACGCTAAFVLAAIQLLSRGGLSQHLLAFGTAGVHSPLAILRGPNQVLYNLLGHASGAVVLVPLAAGGVLLSGGRRQLSIVHVALCYALMLLLVVYADVGTGANQLLDIVVLTVLSAGWLAGRAAADSDLQMRRIIVQLVAVAVIWAGSLDLVRTVGLDLRHSASALAAGAEPRRDARTVAERVLPRQECSPKTHRSRSRWGAGQSSWIHSW